MPRINALRPLLPNKFHPPRGRKEIYLPNFTLTLLRTPHLPAHMASFLVPLWLNKLDMKDYLHHAYNVHVTSVRSFIQQQRVAQDTPGAKIPRMRFMRPRSIKKMTVEMCVANNAATSNNIITGSGERDEEEVENDMMTMGARISQAPTPAPFIYPDEPHDLEPWDKEMYDSAEKANERDEKLLGREKGLHGWGDARGLREEARGLLVEGGVGGEGRGKGERKGKGKGNGKDGWRPSWVDVGEEREVDVDRVDRVDVNGAGRR